MYAKKRGRLETGVFVSETRTWEVVLVVAREQTVERKSNRRIAGIACAMCGNTRVHVGLDVAARDIACLRWGEDDFDDLGRLVIR